MGALPLSLVGPGFVSPIFDVVLLVGTLDPELILFLFQKNALP
jgi:hypothetical protein